MKKSRLAFGAMFLVILFLSVNVLIAVNDEQRNLSAPLSRIVGHWRLSDEDVEMEWDSPFLYADSLTSPKDKK